MAARNFVVFSFFILLLKFVLLSRYSMVQDSPALRAVRLLYISIYSQAAAAAASFDRQTERTRLTFK
jgi:hypothetical protein